MPTRKASKARKPRDPHDFNPRPRSKINRAFASKRAASDRQRVVPTAYGFPRYCAMEHLDPDEHMEVLFETHLLGIRKIALDLPRPEAPMNENPDEAFVFSPCPGRALWNVYHLLRIEEHLNIQPLHVLCLTPSYTQPHLQGVNVRHALRWAGYNPSQANKVSPFKIRDSDVSRMVKMDDYGRCNDRIHRLDSKFNFEPPKNEKRNRHFHYALQVDPLGAGTLHDVIYLKPPVRWELYDHLQGIWRKVAGYLEAHTVPSDYRIEATMKLARSLEIPDEILSAYLGLKSDAMDALPPRKPPFHHLYRLETRPKEFAFLMCLRAFYTLIYDHSSWPLSRASWTLSVSLISGVSPAVFARTALQRFKMTGISTLDESSVNRIVELLEQLPRPRNPRAEANMDELTEELHEIAQEFADHRDGLDLVLQADLEALTTSLRSARPGPFVGGRSPGGPDIDD